MCANLLFTSFVALSVFAYVNSASFITKCKAEDAKCNKQSTQAAIPILAAGIPELGVDTLDPLHIDTVNASSNNLMLIITDALITGLKNCRAKKLQRQPADKKLFIRLQCSAELDGQYEMSGQILIVPFQGKGKIHAGLKNLLINADVDLEDVTGADGKPHWNIKSWIHDFKLTEKSDLVFENLFDGNEVLGRAARELVASSSNEIIAEVGPPVIKALTSIVMDNINKLFKGVPLEELEEQ